MTSAEKLLWDILRRKNFGGYRFLRQHPVFYRIDKEWIEFFIADFYCAKLKLIIELDGKIHNDRLEYDRDRDLKLSCKGISVLRIRNDDLTDLDAVIDLLFRTINSRLIQMSDNKQISSPSFIV